MRAGNQPIIKKALQDDDTQNRYTVDFQSSINAQMYLAKNMKRIVQLLSMNEEASRKSKTAQPVEVPKVQTIDKFMDYRDEMQKIKKETKLFSRNDREKEEAVEMSIEDIILKELGIKSMLLQSICTNGEKDEIYKTRFSNFLFSKLIVCEFCQTFFGLVEFITHVIVWQLREAQGMNINYERVYNTGTLFASLSKAMLLVSIVLRYDVWFKWS